MSTRQDIALEMVRSADRTSLQDLASHLGVSQMTVRRDLDALERQGLVRRVRGGVVPLDHPQTPPPRSPGSPPPGARPWAPDGARAGGEPAQPVRRVEQHSSARTSPPAPATWPPPAPRSSPWAGPAGSSWPGARAGHDQRIGAAVAAMLPPGSSVLLDAGPTAEAVAAHLAARAPLTVAVTSLAAGAALSEVAGITLLVLGGRSRPGGALVGPLALEGLGSLDVDVFVMTAFAHPVSGWSAASLEEAELKRAGMARAATTVVAAGAGVLGARSLARVAPLGAVSALVTDSRADQAAPDGPAAQVLTAMVDAGVHVQVV